MNTKNNCKSPMPFNQYAKYYDLLYKDKDYKRESEYVHSLIKRLSDREVKTVLDIGCGTGIHASFMSDLGYNITGIDMSEGMIDKAKQRKIPNAKFYVHNACNFKFDKKFDVVTSLFHVLSYQTSNESIQKTIQSVSNHLAGGGGEGMYLYLISGMDQRYYPNALPYG